MHGSTDQQIKLWPECQSINQTKGIFAHSIREIQIQKASSGDLYHRFALYTVTAFSCSITVQHIRRRASLLQPMVGQKFKS